MRLEAEKAITQRIVQSMADLGVKVENQSTGKPAPKGRLFVFCEGSSSTRPTRLTANSPLEQETTVRFRLNLEFYELRTHEAAYEIIETLEGLLSGFAPVAKPLFLVSDDFLKSEDGGWFYTVVVAFTHLHRAEVS